MSHLKNKVARRTARLTSVLLAVLMILTVAPIIAFPASAETTTPYRIVHLDCGRKYFSVANIKKLIDTMAQYGYNQLQLAFGNGGCRFLLNDMKLTFKDSSNTDVTLTSDTVKANITDGNKKFNGDTRYLSQTDMDEIITYANDKGIEIVPMLNMPGHAKAIVYNTSYAANDNLNVNNETARNYGYALLKKYVDYFKGKGCKFFHFGSDESGYTGDNMSKFLSGCAKVITDAGMTPRAFNDATNVATMPTSVQITYWHRENGSKTASALANDGYQMINTHGRWYYVIKNAQNSEIGTKYWQGSPNGTSVSVELPTLKAEKMDNKWVGINEYFDGDPGYGSTISGSLGSMFCIWCDASQDAYLTDSDVISENENYGALYQIEKLAEHYWPDDIKKEETTKPTVTVNDGTAVPSQITNGKTLTLKSDKSVTWTTSNPSVIDLLNPANSETITGTSVTLVAKGTGTATITATDSSGNAVSYTITVNDSISGSETIKNVELTVGGSETITIADGITAGSYISGNDSYIATAEVVKTEGQPAGSSKVTSITSGESYYITDGNGNYLTLSNGSLTNVTDVDKATKWTFTLSSGEYRISSGSTYLRYSNNGLTTTPRAYNATSWSYSDSGLSYTYWYTDTTYYITYNNSWTVATTAGNGYPASYVSAVEGKCELTITGVGAGTTSVKIGEVTYNITVTAPEHKETKSIGLNESFTLDPTVPTGGTVEFVISGSNVVTLDGKKVTSGDAEGEATVTATVKNAGGKVVARYTYTIKVSAVNLDNVDPLQVELWITNRYAGGTHNGKTYPATAEGHIVSIDAADAYGANGVLLENLVPTTGADEKDLPLLYWKGTRLASDSKQVYTGDNMSGKGSDFLKIRYYDSAWAYYYNNTWTKVVSTDQIIAYYMQVYNTSPEIVTAFRDYGGIAGKGGGEYNASWFAGYRGLGTAVVYADKSMSPDGDTGIWNNTLLCYYEGSSGGNTPGLIKVFDTENFKITKITITKGVHKDSTGATGANATKTWDRSTSSVLWDKTINDAGDEWYDETVIWTSEGHTPGETITLDDSIWGDTWKTSGIGEAFLLLFYVEPVETEDNLNIVYWDDNANTRINPNNIQISVKSGVTFINGINQTSPVKAGTFTLDADATIENSAGISRKFNKNITILEGISANYRSGIYEYVSAEISEDGKTLTLHYNIKKIEGVHDYIIDFGLPITFNDILKWFNVTDVTTVDYISVAKANKLTVSTGKWGSVKINEDTWNSMTYTLDKILGATATIPLYCKLKNGTQLETFIRVYPASTVYYEEGFIKDNVSGSWTTATDNGSSLGSYDDADKLVPGNRDNVYGYKDNTNTGYSGGSAMTATVNGSATASASFTFTGTGFDLISETGTGTGVIFLDIYSGTETDVANRIKRWVVDTYYGYAYEVDKDNPWLECVWTYGADKKWHVTRTPVAAEGTSEVVPQNPSEGTTFKTYEPNYTWTKTDNGTLKQIPVINFQDLGEGWGTYTVVITAKYNAFFDHTGAGSYTVCIDGVRIYNTLDDSSIYKEDGEYAPDFIEIRDKLINSEDVSGNVNGAAFIDAIGKTNKSDLIRNYGPNNEVYLAAGQTITFTLTSDNVAKLMLGLKAPKGASGVTVTVNGKTQTTITLGTATDMYYQIYSAASGEKTYNIVINNTGSALVSVTTLKVTHTGNSAATQSLLTVNAGLIAEAKAVMLSLIQPEVPVFTPERFEASWTTVTLFRNSVHALVVRTSTDVDHITVDGKEITTFYYAAAFEGWGRNRKLVKYKVFTLFLGNDANIGDYEVVAFDADGVASEAHIATLTGKTGVGKFN